MSDEHRGGGRFITDLSVVLLPAKGGAAIDDHATAHDVSLKGFKIETQAELAVNAVLSFTLTLPHGETASGKGRVVWSNRETFATWAGVEFVSMPWSDKRRLSKLLNPSRTDWSDLWNSCVKLLIALSVIIVAGKLVHSWELRRLFFELLPKFIALSIMGWALTRLLRRDRR